MEREVLETYSLNPNHVPLLKKENRKFQQSLITKYSAHLEQHLRVFSVLNQGGDHNGGQDRYDHPGQLLLGHEVVEQGQTPVVYF